MKDNLKNGSAVKNINGTNQINKIRDILFGENLSKQDQAFSDLNMQIKNLEQKNNAKFEELSNKFETLFAKLENNLKEIVSNNENKNQEISNKISILKKDIKVEIDTNKTELNNSIDALKQKVVYKNNLADVFLELAKQA